jgi:hypothetical protein
LSAPTADSPASIAHSSGAQPAFGRAAIAILGTMIFLIIALSALLVRATWVDPASAAEVPTLETPSFAQN